MEISPNYGKTKTDHFFCKKGTTNLYDKKILKYNQLSTSSSLIFNMLRKKGATSITILCHGDHTSPLCIFH